MSRMKSRLKEKKVEWAESILDEKRREAFTPLLIA